MEHTTNVTLTHVTNKTSSLFSTPESQVIDVPNVFAPCGNHWSHDVVTFGPIIKLIVIAIPDLNSIGVYCSSPL